MLLSTALVALLGVASPERTPEEILTEIRAKGNQAPNALFEELARQKTPEALEALIKGLEAIPKVSGNEIRSFPEPFACRAGLSYQRSHPVTTIGENCTQARADKSGSTGQCNDSVFDWCQAGSGGGGASAARDIRRTHPAGRVRRLAAGRCLRYR